MKEDKSLSLLTRGMKTYEIANYTLIQSVWAHSL
jgi:hypothetical protein